MIRKKTCGSWDSTIILYTHQRRALEMTFQVVGFCFFFTCVLLILPLEVKQTVSRGEKKKKKELTPLSGYVAPSLPLTLWPSWISAWPRPRRLHVAAWRAHFLFPLRQEKARGLLLDQHALTAFTKQAALTLRDGVEPHKVKSTAAVIMWGQYSPL